jgi:hypothetical protein
VGKRARRAVRAGTKTGRRVSVCVCVCVSVLSTFFLLPTFLLSTSSSPAHLLSLSYRGHLCTFVCLLSYFLTFLLTCVHTSSLSLIGGTCAPLSVYFLTFLLSYFLTYMRAHLLSLSYRGHVCRGYKLRTLPLPSINAMPSTPQGSARRPNPTKPSRHARPRQVHVGVGWIPPLVKAPSNDTRPCPYPYEDAPN